jgi:hypothetical protein
MLTEDRMGKIALVICRNLFRQERIQLGSISRGIGQKAKALSLPVDELTEFCEVLFREVMDENFPKKK